jgi:acetoin utilization protein AcuC
MCQAGVLFGEALAKYGFGNSHPFGSDRVYAFWSKLQSQGLCNIVVEEPELASEQDVLSFHNREYVELVKIASKHGSRVPLDTGDTPAFKGVFEAALYVVGSTLAALDMVVRGTDRFGRKIDHAFNPIGGLHHARRESAGGFCVFNDIAVAIMKARKKYGIKRIAYVDIDAHHGDGVFYGFEDDPLLFIADIHEDGRYLYPGTGFSAETGKGNAAGTKMNIPLEPKANDDEFVVAFDRVERFVDDVKPELIILQCGADGLVGDPITHLQYSIKAHRFAVDKLHKLAHKYCKGRIVALGGGGYNRENIGNAWTEVVKSLASEMA